MEIKVLGTGCAGCRELYQTVLAAVKTAGIDAVVTKEEDMAKILSYNVMRLPALVIDSKVVSSGKKLSQQEVLQFIR